MFSNLQVNLILNTWSVGTCKNYISLYLYYVLNVWKLLRTIIILNNIKLLNIGI